MKRCVFITPSGMAQILGVTPKPPTLLPPFNSLGTEIPFASLYKVTRRIAWYKEPLVPGAKHSFDKAQR